MNKPILIQYPKDKSIIYSKHPRILMQLQDDMSRENAIIYVTLKNQDGVFNYTSIMNPKNFSAIAFNNNAKLAFTCDDFSYGKNRLSIAVYHDNDFSENEILDIIYEEPLLNINNDYFPISTDVYEKLLIMTNSTLDAYSRDKLDIKLPIKNITSINRQYFREINNALYDLNSWINKTYPGLARIKIKQIINMKKISLDIYNSLIDLIINL